ncbi:metallophosphoesterase [Candidatus Bipolaricaulota bacterium]|nr:metallophosphoesterase [Candidatus Bipolaricaulota bacterium]
MIKINSRTPSKAEHRIRITRPRLLVLTVVLLLLLGGLAGAAYANSCRGTVFLDANGNQLRDAEEAGIAAIAVSDGATITQTADQGAFELPLDEAARFVFIAVPSGYRASGSWYVSIPESEDLMAIDFGLEVTPDADGVLTFVQASDIHFAATPEEFREAFYDRAMAVQPQGILDTMAVEINSLAPDFVILTGDQVADSRNPELALVESWTSYIADHLVASLDAPTRAAVGNHEVVRDPEVDRAVFERSFGPTYYAFDCEGVHCIVLDPHTLIGTSLSYTISDRQLGWLREDLEAAGEQQPILVFCHEPSSNWAENEIMDEVKTLLADFHITALVTGHWHLSYELQTEPYLELTSGAVCGAWWEGPGPDGRSFGYRVYQVRRGMIDSVWRTIGEETVDFASPQAAVLAWNDRLQAQVWGAAISAELAWDGNPLIEIGTTSYGMWSAIHAELNVSTLSNGYHTLHVSFAMADGSRRNAERRFYIWNPEISLAEILDSPDVFQGCLVAAPSLTVRAVLGNDASVNDGTKTIIVADVPFPVVRNDRLALMGLFRPTSTDPIKAYDESFMIKLDEESDDES